MPNVLVLAEKPSVAKSISAVLGATARKDGFFIGAGYIVTWCIGHLVEMAKPEAYDARYTKWRREDLPILPAEFRMTAPKSKAKQLKIIAGLMARPDVESIVCATDAGREGELIFRHVYEYCNCSKPVERLWISSMEERAIEDGFAKLRPGADYTSLYHAALCRARADWIVGINATRLFSTLYGNSLSVGRVMTPTLALLTQRADEITAFKKEPWYMVELECPVEKTTFTASGEKHRDRQAVEAILAACVGQAVAMRSVDKQEKTENPPRLYDLTTLQRDANRIFGFTAQQTLDYLQSLYEKKLATYPRTDSRFLTEDMAATAGSIVNYLQTHHPCAQGAGYTPNMARVIDGTRVNDHHAVIPTMEIAAANPDELLTGERNILDLLCVRLLCATAEPHTYEAVSVTLDCGGHSFTAGGKTVMREGWKAIERAFAKTLKEQPEKENVGGALPALDEGRVLDGMVPTVKEGHTSPPRPYSEDTLLAAMEKAGAADIPEDAEHKGLGTPATRAATIEKLVKTGYVKRAKKQLLPTDKGRNLIAVLPNALKSQALTSRWEEKLARVERGEISPEDFMAGIAAMTRELVENHTAPDPAYAALFAQPDTAAKPVGACPRCGGTVLERAKGFFCDKRECGFALWKNDRFFTGKGAKLDKKTAAALLKDGQAKMSGLVSQKSGKTYSAVVVMNDTGKYVNFTMEF